VGFLHHCRYFVFILWIASLIVRYYQTGANEILAATLDFVRQTQGQLDKAIVSRNDSSEQQRSRKSAIVYLGNEGHFGSQRSGRPSCGSILESLQSLARHLPLVAMTTNNQSSSYQEAPVIMFLHEDELSNATIDALTDASPFPVSFHKFVFDQPRDKQWENEKDLNYKRMCAFWFHYFFELDFLPDYVMRMDTDSCLTSDMDIDPFEYVIENNVEYMYHSTLMDHPSVLVGLSDFVKQHPGGSPNNVNRTALFWPAGGENIMIAHSTNLEFMYVPSFRTPQVLEWKDGVRRNGGIFRERWGDAPLRSLVTAMFLDTVTRFCPFTYNHSSWGERRQCVGTEFPVENGLGWTTVYRNVTTGAVVEGNAMRQTERQLH
jgi:Glycolipid 2-alpha-mannosyltransferase